ncbi:MAG: hypothetical protein ACKOFI_05995, partial [Phycisphaerales bacterium]
VVVAPPRLAGGMRAEEGAAAPGPTVLGAQRAVAHLPRCVAVAALGAPAFPRGACRRRDQLARLDAVALGEPVGDPLLRYMNRLSDLFFAMARRANHERGHADVAWKPRAH